MQRENAIAPSADTRFARLRRHPTIWPVLALALLLAFNVALTPGFARFEVRDGRLIGAIVDIVQNGAPVMLLAIGMTLVIALAGIDLSVGSVMALAGAVAAVLLEQHNDPASVGVAVVAALAAAVAVGVWNGALVTFVGLQPIVATLAMLAAGRGLAMVLTHDQKVPVYAPSFASAFAGAVAGVPAPVLYVAAAAVLIVVALRKTVLGLYVEAIGGNASAARLCGLPVHVMRLAVYGFCGLCAGVAGLIQTADINLADVANCGLYLELDAILAVVIGGTSLLGGRPHLIGSLLGALIMQTLTVMLNMWHMQTEHTLIIKALVALAVCLVQAPRFREMLRRRAVRPAAAPPGGAAEAT